MEQQLTKTQEEILKSAKAHFLKYGFQKASLNQIIKDTGFTKGAFYGYYSSKEELFCALVQSALDGIQAILARATAHWRSYPKEQRAYHMTEAFLAAVPELVDFVLAHRDEAVLLLSRAGGTRYEHFLDDMQASDEQEGQNNLRSSLGDDYIPAKTYRIMMSGYFSMLKSVFLSDMTRDEMISAITDIQLMFEAGIISLAETKAKGKR